MRNCVTEQEGAGDSQGSCLYEAAPPLQPLQTYRGRNVDNKGLADPKVNIRILLAALWICHFILWIFGDMFTILLGMNESITEEAVLYVAPTTAIVLTLMVAFTLVGPPAYVRMANIVVAVIYFLFDFVFFVDATEGWEFYLGVFYVLFVGLIMWNAYKWPKAADVQVSG